MASNKDVTSQSDVTKIKLEPDGSFKRVVSTFRNFVEKDGKFPPEKGTLYLLNTDSILLASNIF